MSDVTVVKHSDFPLPKTDASKAKKAKPTSPQADGGVVTHFALEKETKGALRYMQVKQKGDVAAWLSDEGAQIGTLYIRKAAFADNVYPKSITVSITVN
jgi:hypothetical protein